MICKMLLSVLYNKTLTSCVCVENVDTSCCKELCFSNKSSSLLLICFKETINVAVGECKQHTKYKRI